MKKRISLTIALGLFLTAGAAIAGGQWMGFPIVGVPANTVCESTGNNGVCNQYVPAGPTAIPPTATIPADTQLPNGQNPQTVRVPVTFFAQAMGNAQVVTTNASVAIADGTNVLISSQGVATIALVNLPPNPANNQVVTIANAGSGVLTLTSIAVASGSGQSIVGGAAPATLAIQTNNAAAAALSSVSYIYQAANTTWYRIR